MRNTISYCLSSIKQVYTPPTDPAWRGQLVPGSKLDALLLEPGESERSEAWAGATVREIVDDLLHCSFDGLIDCKYGQSSNIVESFSVATVRRSLLTEAARATRAGGID
jgi:hypothetical protein